jgi:hypothetical protein
MQSILLASRKHFIRACSLFRMPCRLAAPLRCSRLQRLFRMPCRLACTFALFTLAKTVPNALQACLHLCAVHACKDCSECPAGLLSPLRCARLQRLFRMPCRLACTFALCTLAKTVSNALQACLHLCAVHACKDCFECPTRLSSVCVYRNYRAR